MTSAFCSPCDPTQHLSATEKCRTDATRQSALNGRVTQQARGAQNGRPTFLAALDDQSHERLTAALDVCGAVNDLSTDCAEAAGWEPTHWTRNPT
jgi:hypothetical protein